MATVSVVMPAYNAERYIGDALGSICEQTLRDVEVIVVDDGSTDATIRSARRFSGALDLKILRQQNAGPSAARNAGIRAARGRYCALLDADDVMLPELLAAQVRLLEDESSVGMVLTNITTFDDGGTIQEKHWNLDGLSADALLERLVVENFVTTSAVMARTSCLIEAGLFPEDRRVAEDYELWLRLAARWKMAFIDQPMVRYRYTSGSLSSDKLYSSRCALEVIEAFWREHGAYAAGRPRLFHRSMARHLTNAAGAAAVHGNRRDALGYVARALRHDPATLGAWKWLVKLLIRSTDRMNGGRPRHGADAVAATSTAN